MINCVADPAVFWRLKIDVKARRAILASDAWSDAVEAAIRLVEQGDKLEAKYRAIIDAAIIQDMADGSGLMARDLTELLALVKKRELGDTIMPPACTPEQLLAVPCPTCGAAAGASCEVRPGKVLLLPQHHAERFWAAHAAIGTTAN